MPSTPRQAAQPQPQSARSVLEAHIAALRSAARAEVSPSCPLATTTPLSSAPGRAAVAVPPTPHTALPEPAAGAGASERYDELVRATVRRAWETAWSNYQSGDGWRGPPLVTTEMANAAPRRRRAGPGASSGAYLTPDGRTDPHPHQPASNKRAPTSYSMQARARGSMAATTRGASSVVRRSSVGAPS